MKKKILRKIDVEQEKHTIEFFFKKHRFLCMKKLNLHNFKPPKLVGYMHICDKTKIYTENDNEHCLNNDIFNTNDYILKKLRVLEEYGSIEELIEAGWIFYSTIPINTEEF